MTYCNFGTFPVCILFAPTSRIIKWSNDCAGFGTKCEKHLKDHEETSKMIKMHIPRSWRNQYAVMLLASAKIWFTVWLFKPYSLTLYHTKIDMQDKCTWNEWEEQIKQINERMNWMKNCITGSDLGQLWSYAVGECDCGTFVKSGSWASLL